MPTSTYRGYTVNSDDLGTRVEVRYGSDLISVHRSLRWGEALKMARAEVDEYHRAK